MRGDATIGGAGVAGERAMLMASYDVMQTVLEHVMREWHSSLQQVEGQVSAGGVINAWQVEALVNGDF